MHEAVNMGPFLPGQGKFPVEKIPEKEFKLLRTRSELPEPPPPEQIEETQLEQTQEVPSPANVAPSTPGTTVPGPSPNAKAIPVEVSPSQSPMAPPPVPESRKSKKDKKEKKDRDRDSSPAPSSCSSRASEKPAVYAKYKDGSYWKFLVSYCVSSDGFMHGCVVMCFHVPKFAT